MLVVRSKFNRLKQEVNSELSVYAGDLVSVLEKTTEKHPEWRVPLEDLLLIARTCVEMSPEEFWLRCESIVQNMDDRRQELPMGPLKQAHTRLLFIMTRCTRLLQFQKESGSGESDHVLGRHQFSDLGFYPEQTSSGEGAGQVLKSSLSAKAIKEKLIRKKLHEHGLSSAYLSQDFAGRPLTHSSGTDSPGSRDRISSWKKLPSAAEKNHKKSDDAEEGEDGLHTKKVLDTLPHLDWRKVHLEDAKDRPDKNRLAIVTDACVEAKHDGVDHAEGQDGDVDDKPKMICRICDFEIPTLHAEAHFKVCSIADRCDSKGLTVDERLEKISEILESILEPSMPRSLDAAVVNHDAARANASYMGDEPADLTPNMSHRSSMESNDSFPEAVSSRSNNSDNGLLSILCNKPYVAKLDLGALAPSSGSITPRSPLSTPGPHHIDLLLAVKSAFSELENFQQVPSFFLRIQIKPSWNHTNDMYMWTWPATFLVGESLT